MPFCYFWHVLPAVPPPSLPLPLNFISSLFIVLPGPSPSSTLPWWEQFPVGGMQTPEIHRWVGCRVHIPQPPKKKKKKSLCRGNPWCLLRETSKKLLWEELTFYAEQFVPLHFEAKQEMWEMCFLSPQIEGTCVTCMHVAPVPKSCMPGYPTTKKNLSLVMFPKRW